MNIFYWAVPVFIISILVEWHLTRKQDVVGYTLKDTATNLSMGVGNLILQSGSKVLTLAMLMLVYPFRFFDLAVEAWWFWPLLLVCDDFCFYWYHRAGHQIRLFWAGHVNHHSAQTYNLSTALRQSWTSPFYSFVFWLPLPLLGFHPMWILLSQAISLLYQFWIHTELVNKTGPLGWVLNTPSHHRVHHASNHAYLDRNHGGIFIIWDRIFGTFTAETEQPVYGLTQNIDSHNPVVVATHEWGAMIQDVRRCRTWRGRLGTLFGPPGWREDGSGRTAADLREAVIASSQTQIETRSTSPKGASKEAHPSVTLLHSTPA